MTIAPLVFLGCVTQSANPSPAPAVPAAGRSADLAPANGGKNPCADFEAYVCSPAGPKLGRLQSVAGEVTRRSVALWRFMDEIAAGKHDDGTKGIALVREFYGRCKDVNARTPGKAELRETLNRLAKLETVADLARALGVLGASGLSAVISFTPSPDARELNGPFVAFVGISGPRLPRSLYRAKSPLLTERRKHWLQLASLTGAVSPSEVDAAIRVDDWLATPDKPHDASPTQEPPPTFTRATLRDTRFPWSLYLDGLGLAPTAPIRSVSTSTFDRVDRLVQLPFEDLRSYLRMSLVEAYAPYVTPDFLEEEVRFHDEVLGELHHQAFRLPSACVGLTMRALRPWLADAYLNGLTHPPSEEAARRMFAMIRAQVIDLVGRATWMSAGTRQAATEKLERTALQFIGDVEPAGIDSVVVRPGSFLDLLVKTVSQTTRIRLAQVGTAPSERGQQPTFDAARYSGPANTVWLSSEIVRPPFIRIGTFDPVSFGALGIIIGHELAHALSPEGRRFDATGAYHESWSKESIAALGARMACLERQFGQIDVGSGSKLNGRWTANENVSDLVGVQLALRAMDNDGGPTSDQTRQDRRREFFIAFAQQTCGWSPDERPEIEALVDPHATARARINGVLADVPEFAETFQCPAGAPMAPRQRCAIW